ncbi:MAG: hypothetical protein PWQ18_1031, partial [Clostridia bacterium]|nr:hypothetical protein [Clostridia bacterium]
MWEAGRNWLRQFLINASLLSSLPFAGGG